MPSPEFSLEERMTLAFSGTSAVLNKTFSDWDTHGQLPFPLRRIDAGKILLPSGRICVADIYSADQYPALNRIAPEGEYPVSLVIAARTNHNERCAFMTVKFTDEPPVAWQPATAVQSASPCFTEERPNVVVQEGGTGIFSPEAGRVHLPLVSKDSEAVFDALREKSHTFGSNTWINHRPGAGPENMVICEGGMGDGNAHCFVGLTAQGRISHLIVDFGICDPVPGTPR